MQRAEILLEDGEAGEGAAMRFVFPGGFNPASPSHQLCNIIRGNLDRMAEAGTITALTPESQEGDCAGLASMPNAQMPLNV